MALDLTHATKAQLLAAFRARYRDSAGEMTVRLADWVIARLEVGDVTDAEMAAAFGINAGQWTAAKARLKSHSNNRRAVLSARGE